MENSRKSSHPPSFIPSLQLFGLPEPGDEERSGGAVLGIKTTGAEVQLEGRSAGNLGYTFGPWAKQNP